MEVVIFVIKIVMFLFLLLLFISSTSLAVKKKGVKYLPIFYLKLATIALLSIPKGILVLKSKLK